MSEREMPSDFRLEQLALDEGPAGLRERLHETDVRERIEALRREDSAILAAYPPGRVLAVVRARASAAKAKASRSIHWLVTAPVLVALAAMLLIMLRVPDVVPSRDPDDTLAQRSDVWVVPDDRPEAGSSETDASDTTASEVRAPRPKTAPSDGIRIKGQQAHLVIHRRESDGPVRLAEDAVVEAHDLLQLGYVAAGRGHGVIVSIDGAGAVTLHFPDAVDESSALEQGEVVALAHAYELDDAPAFERFVFVTADSPIDPATVVRAAERLAETPKRARAKRLSLPSSWEQSSMLLRKAEP